MDNAVLTHEEKEVSMILHNVDYNMSKWQADFSMMSENTEGNGNMSLVRLAPNSDFLLTHIPLSIPRFLARPTNWDY